MRDFTQQDFWSMQGGLITELGVLNVPVGSLSACKNFELTEAGYARCSGYERFDGRTSPSSIVATVDDDAEREAARALIQPVSGSGAILGVVFYKGSVYAFRNATDGLSAKMWKSSSSGWVEVNTGVTLAPNGKYKFAIYNFYAGADSQCLYGVDGENKAFQFDGTTFTQITTGNAIDKPYLVAGHSMHLFLAFDGGSLQHSATGEPLDWDAVHGAGEIGIGDDVTSLAPMVGGVLQIGAKSKVMMLSGSSSLDWTLSGLKTQDDSTGVLFDSARKVMGDVYYVTNNGIRVMSATNAYGDFAVAAVSKLVDSVVVSRIKNGFVGVVRVDDKSQYRVYSATSSGVTDVITLSFGSQGVLGFTSQSLNFQMSCLWQSSGDGGELIVYGGNDGFVYLGDVGSSFDGDIIHAFLRTVYAHQRSPSVRKRYKKLNIVMNTAIKVDLVVKPSFDFNASDSGSHAVKTLDVEADGGTWGQSVWGSFAWQSFGKGFVDVDIGGNGQSISVYLENKDKFNDKMIITNMILDYIPRRLKR